MNDGGNSLSIESFPNMHTSCKLMYFNVVACIIYLSIIHSTFFIAISSNLKNVGFANNENPHPKSMD